jgi:hypothetical protein
MIRSGSNTSVVGRREGIDAVSKFGSVDWERLWKILMVAALRVTSGFAVDSKTADDLVQETLLAYWQSPDGWKSAKGPLEAYLVGILYHKATDSFRRQKFIAGSVNDPEGPYTTVRAPDLVEHDARVASHWRALERLVAGRKDLEDLVTAAQIRTGGPHVNNEIGELMGKTPPQVAKLKIKLVAVPGVKELLYGERRLQQS